MSKKQIINLSSDSQRKPKTSKIPLWVLGLLVGLSIIILFVLFMLTRVPATYRPTAVQEADGPSSYLTHHLAPDMYNNIQLDKPFNPLVQLFRYIHRPRDLTLAIPNPDTVLAMLER